MHVKRLSMFALFCTLAFWFGACHSDRALGAASPLVPEALFDFGEVIETEPVVHDFVIKNTGDSVLQITSVAPS